MCFLSIWNWGLSCDKNGICWCRGELVHVLDLNVRVDMAWVRPIFSSKTKFVDLNDLTHKVCLTLSK